jgi:hypothetical protein
MPCALWCYFLMGWSHFLIADVWPCTCVRHLVFFSLHAPRGAIHARGHVILVSSSQLARLLRRHILLNTVCLCARCAYASHIPTATAAPLPPELPPAPNGAHVYADVRYMLMTDSWTEWIFKDLQAQAVDLSPV